MEPWHSDRKGLIIVKSIGGYRLFVQKVWIIFLQLVLIANYSNTHLSYTSEFNKKFGFTKNGFYTGESEWID